MLTVGEVTPVIPADEVMIAPRDTRRPSDLTDTRTRRKIVQAYNAFTGEMATSPKEG